MQGIGADRYCRIDAPVGRLRPCSNANQDQSSYEQANLTHLNSPVDMDSPPCAVTPANLNRIGIVEMSLADDLVSFVSPRLSLCCLASSSRKKGWDARYSMSNTAA
jgi:hypothetical protein